MLITIPDLLNPTEVDAVSSVLRRARFVDGKLSAGRDAAAQKNNEELAEDPERYDALNNVVMTRLVQHPLYLRHALPARISAPIYARYTSGMAYGGHIDDPVMGAAGARYRSDVSVTVFLSDPDQYEGGELCIESPQGPVEIKLPAGQALLYDSTCYHSVKPVTSGERLVAIAWIQSLVRRGDQREILARLDAARERLHEDEHDSARQIDLSYANLLRMWAET